MIDGYRQTQSRLAHHVRRVLVLLRLKPFDTSTPSGLSQERYRRMVITSLTAIAARGIGVVAMLISIPLTYHYLGAERFGLWMTLGSMVAFLGFADLGIGNGLINAISEANGRQDETRARKHISSCFFMLCGMTLGLVGSGLLVYDLVPWARLFKVSSELAVQETGPALAVFAGCVVVGIPFGTVQKVQQGYQEGYATNLWQLAGRLAGLMGLFLSVYCRAGLPWLVLAVAGPPVLVLIVNWLYFFKVQRPSLFPSVAYFEWKTSWGLARVGGAFFLLSLFAFNWFLVDNVIIMQLLGVSAVAEYAPIQRLFSVGLVAQFLITPLLPAYGEAIARGDHAWARKTLNRALTSSLVMTAAVTLPLLVFGQPIVRAWLHAEPKPPLLLLLGFTFLNLLMIVGGNLSSLLVHGSYLRRQVWFYGLASCVALLLKVVLVPRAGVPGVVWASVLGFGFLYTPFALRLAYQSVRGTERGAPPNQGFGT